MSQPLESWSANAVPLASLRKSRGGGDEAEHRTLNITVSLTLLAAGIAVACGLSIWGVMFAVSSEAYEFFGMEVQLDLLSAFRSDLGSFFTPVVNSA